MPQYTHPIYGSLGPLSIKEYPLFFDTCFHNSDALEYGEYCSIFSDQREADLAVHLTPRQLPQMTRSLSDTLGPEDTSSAKTIGHIPSEINLLNQSVLTRLLVLKRSFKAFSVKENHVTFYSKV